MSDTVPDAAADMAAISSALRAIPVTLLSDTITGLLGATRTERKSVVVRDPSRPDVPGKREDTLHEIPDWPTRLRTVEIVIAHRMGAPSARKPIEPEKPKGDGPAVGLLRQKSGGKSKVDSPKRDAGD